MSKIIVVILMAVAFVGALWLYPFDADGPFAMHDGIWYGINAEIRPREAVIGHHPLFHVIALGLVAGLKVVGVGHPGHVAVRIIAGLGAAALIGLVARASGKRRWVGLMAVAMLCATRSFIVEAAVGENVLPACAAALWCLMLAAEDAPRLPRVGFALWLALLLRQDNLLIVPAVVTAVVSAWPRGARASRVTRWLAIVALATAAAYLLIWLCAAPPKQGLIAWLFRLNETDWNAPADRGFTWSGVLAHAQSLGVAAFGRQWGWAEIWAWTAIPVMVPFVLGGFLLRGSEPWRRFIVAALITSAVRFPFYVWFEARNEEWHILTLVLLAAGAAAAARGVAVMGRTARFVGVGIAGVGVAVALWLHLVPTIELRERKLMTCIEGVVAEGRDRWRFIAHGHAVGAGFYLLGVKRDVLVGELDGNLLARLFDEIRRKPGPTLFLTDRFTLDGMPWTRRNPPPMRLVDDPSFATAAGLRLFRRDGLVYAALFDLGNPGGGR